MVNLNNKIESWSWDQWCNNSLWLSLSSNSVNTSCSQERRYTSHRP